MARVSKAQRQKELKERTTMVRLLRTAFYYAEGGRKLPKTLVEDIEKYLKGVDNVK